MSFRNRAIRPETDGADHYFLFGPYMKRGFDESGILPADDPRGVEIGFPKTDRLLDGSQDRGEMLAAARCQRGSAGGALRADRRAPQLDGDHG